MGSVRKALLGLGLTLFASVGIAVRAADAPDAEKPPAPAPYITQKTSLAIPFSVGDGRADFQPAEVQVFISFDRGVNWNLYSRHRPQEGEFVFRARRDGEYWLATRTIDRQGKAFPAGSLVPQLRVIVDTAPPKLDLAAEVNPAGDVQLQWKFGDELLEPASLQLEFQEATTKGDAPWQPISIEAPGPNTIGAIMQGQTAWQPKTNQRVVNVRAHVKDKANNVTVVNRQIFLPKGNEDAVAKRPQIPGGIAAHPLPQAGGISPKPASQEMLPPIAVKPNVPPTAGESPPATAIVAKPGDVPWPAAGSAAAAAAVAANARPSPEPEPTPASPGRLASTGGYPLNNAPPETAPPPSPTNEVPLPKAPVATSQPTPQQPQPENWLANERPRLTNNRRFRLEYDVESLTAENLADVELWGTGDGGRTWAKWGSDADRTSPFEVEVSSEAIYGFRIVIVARNGVSSRPPQAGDSADVWIQVDTSAPTVRITQAAYGTAEKAGQLDIRWEANDQQLTARPITLQFSDRPAGPFTTIAAGLPNTGQYWWPFDPRTPRQIYLRLEAKDEAGNVGHHLLADPISVEGLIPRGRIKGVTSPESGEQGAFRSPLFR